MKRIFHITKICLCNFEPLKHHSLYSKTGVYRGIHYFSISAHKHRLWVLIRTASSSTQQSMFWAEIWKKIRIFYLKYLVVMFSVYQNRHVFVMQTLYVLPSRVLAKHSKVPQINKTNIKNHLKFNGKCLYIYKSTYLLHFTVLILWSLYISFMILSRCQKPERHSKPHFRPN